MKVEGQGRVGSIGLKMGRLADLYYLVCHPASNLLEVKVLAPKCQADNWAVFCLF